MAVAGGDYAIVVGLFMGIHFLAGVPLTFVAYSLGEEPRWAMWVLGYLDKCVYVYGLMVIHHSIGLLHFRHAWTQTGFWAGNIGLTIFFGLSALDPNFNKVIAKPDNIPILIMVYTVWWTYCPDMEQETERSPGLSRREEDGGAAPSRTGLG